MLILTAIIVMWCVSKRWGFFLLYTGLLGQVVNQTVKIAFEIPRPWIAYPDFNPVPTAIEAAQGYSFPSGHTQCVTSLFGGVAAINRKKPLIFWACAAVVFLTGLSRCYLGVHYPSDVIVSWVIGILLILMFYRLFENYQNHSSRIYDILRVAAVIVCAAFCVYTFCAVGGGKEIFDIDSMSNSVKLFGASVAFVICWKIDEKYIKYDEKAPVFGQILKVLVGVVIVFAIKTYLKAPLVTLLGNKYAADGVRYFLLVVFAGNIWPLTFKYWKRVGAKEKNY